jgi:phosphatidylinositol alpha-1,6-mannosyltransferase
LTPRWAVTVLAPADGEAGEYDRSASFRVLRTRRDWRASPLAVLAEMALMVARTPADVLLAGHLSVLPSLFAAAPPRPKVALVYGSELWAPRTRLVARLLGPRVERVMAISRFTALEAGRAGIAPKRIVITAVGAGEPRGHERRREILERLGLIRGDAVVPFFLTVSRLDDPHKGHDVFLRCLPALLERHPDLVYVIAGQGLLAGQLSRLAEELGVGPAVRMLGAVDEVTKGALLAACRAFVMVSRESRHPALFEGFGIGYLEAALAGRPALGGASGGVPDAVLHEQTGLLVDPLSVPAVTAAARRLLEEPGLADALGERAELRARRDFTWEVAVERMERCLESVLR